MDVTTIVGLLLALGMVLFPFVTRSEVESMPLALFFVFGGTLGATVLSVPRKSLRAALSGVLVAFVDRRRSPRQLVDSIVRLSDIARRDGILALEDKIPRLENDFLERALRLAVDGTEPAVLEATLAEEIDATHGRHEAGKLVLELIARYAPAYGMLGTLTGLIHMLWAWNHTADALTTPELMLPRMAFALLTTFCGILLANTIALPLSDKLSEKDREETLEKRIVVSGILAIQSGDNPRIVREKLNVFLPPGERL